LPPADAIYYDDQALSNIIYHRRDIDFHCKRYFELPLRSDCACYRLRRRRRKLIITAHSSHRNALYQLCALNYHNPRRLQL
jgi:hypothetical protein